MAYTTINKHSAYIKNKLFTGTGADNNAVTGVGFRPDLLWIRQRNAMSHRLYDVIRGVNAALNVDNTAAENQYSAYGQLESFDSDGFTVGAGTSNGHGTNENGQSIVSWNWLAGGSAGSSNTDGTINTTYTSVNTTAGISISTYTGNNTANATFGHGLGAVPQVVIIKRRDTTASWITKMPSTTDGYFYLNEPDAISSSSGWLPVSSSTVTLANQWTAYNASGGNYVAYCFAEKTGFSKFGKYTGNSSTDGTFVYTGFKPVWVMIKEVPSAGAWRIFDNVRPGYNEPYGIIADTGDAEETADNRNKPDFYSNGFKLKFQYDDTNATGTEYVYMAFGQSLVGSNNVPCTAGY